jgi:hypothetical protein
MIAHLIDKVKILSFLWMKTHNSCLVFDIHHWWVNPLMFYGINYLMMDGLWFVRCGF